MNDNRIKRSMLALVLAGGMAAASAQNVNNATTGKADDTSGAGGQSAIDEAAAAAAEVYDKDVKQVFAGNCSWCHQGYGTRDGDGPKLSGTALSEEQVAEVIRKGKTPMPGYASKLKDEQIRALARFIKALPAS